MQKTSSMIPSSIEAPLESTREVSRSIQKAGKAFEWWRLLALPLLLFIAIPILSIFLRTPFSDFFATLNQSQVISAINLSLVTSSITTCVALLAGIPVALMIAKKNTPLRQWMDTLMDLPTVLPPSVAGVALLMAFGRNGLLGPFLQDLGVQIPFTMIAVIMAQLFIASPLFVKAASIGFAAIDPSLVQAAELDGANRWQMFRYVMLPLSWSSLMSGGVMTWARSMGEFGATIIFAGNFPGRTQTMPLAIYLGFEIDMKVALTLAAIMVCFSFLTLAVVKGVLHNHIDPIS
jgi:molybdate transport system permease protein